MANINYFVNVPDKKGDRSVSLVIHHNGTRKVVLTEIKLLSKEVTKSGNIKNPFKLHAIDNIIRSCEDKIYSNPVKFMDPGLTASDIWTMLSRERTDIDFFSFADKWLKKSRIKGKKNYSTCLSALEKFIHKRSLPVSEISVSFLERFSDYLSDRPRAQSLYLGEFRHLFNELRRQYDINLNPFNRFKVPRQIPKGGRALDTNVLKEVFSYVGTSFSRSTLARDCAVLSFSLMGMNAVDLYNARTLKDGYICYERTKTKDRRYDHAYIEVKVPELIQPLMKKWEGTSRVFRFYSRYSSAMNFNQALNKGLKEIGEAIGVQGLQFYAFRHSWASIARNEVGIDKWTVHEALNHVDRDTRIDDLYIKKDFMNINKANEKVMEYVHGIGLL